MYNEYRGGILEVIVGPMFSSKSTTLLSRIETMAYADKSIGVFKISKDTRYSDSEIVTHNGKRVSSMSVVDSAMLLDKYREKYYDAVAIDEVQFFDDQIVEVIEYILNNGARVFVAGLDQTFRGDSFNCIGELLARAEIVTKLTAVCSVCGGAATKSQRLIEGRPANADDPVFHLGASENYEARCRLHHEI